MSGWTFCKKSMVRCSSMDFRASRAPGSSCPMRSTSSRTATSWRSGTPGSRRRADLENPTDSTFVPKVDGVIALGTKPLDDAHPHAHVGEESHARRLYRTNFLASQPGGVLKGLLDVLSLQVRVILEDLVEGGAVSDLAHDHGHRD